MKGEIEMPRGCFGNYPNTIGFPCLLCEDSEECKLVKIPKGSKVTFYVNGDMQTEAETMEDMTIHPNAITMINGLLVCTDNITPAKKVADKEYRVDCRLQDCMYVSDGKAYQSISNT